MKCFYLAIGFEREPQCIIYAIHLIPHCTYPSQLNNFLVIEVWRQSIKHIKQYFSRHVQPRVRPRARGARSVASSGSHPN